MQLLGRPPASKPACAHAAETSAAPQAAACQDCGSRFNLRLCATCGQVGCCESQGGHARAHALSEGHPVIEQLPDGFTWCYAERRYVG